MSHTLIHIAPNIPVRQLFSYYLPTELCDQTVKPGMRVAAPFGQKTIVAIVLATELCDTLNEKLKPISRIIDAKPIVQEAVLALLQRSSDYYQHPLGEALQAALPSLLKKAAALPLLGQDFLTLLDTTFTPLARAKAQSKVITTLKQQGAITREQISTLELSPSAIKTLTSQNTIGFKYQPLKPKPLNIGKKPTLNTEQQQCLDNFQSLNPGFERILLEGITGSGKTEVYLQLIEQSLKRGQQAMVLVPEIGLTPQTLERFKKRFSGHIAVLHSKQTDKQRLYNWQLAQAGLANIIIGTRSAVFCSAPKLGLIIVDEEHDSSYKQQDGFKYHGRDIAIMRAQQENIAIVLGSATPSLETLNNALLGKYHHWQLNNRAGNAQKADIQLLDIRKAPMHEGISEQALTHIEHHLEQKQQVLIFLNRRGFAPSLLCHDCGWCSQCHACDQKLTVHLQARHMRCHQCQSISPIPNTCPECKSSQLRFEGVGTQRIEQFLQQQFPEQPIFRIDRDSTQNAESMGQLKQQLEQTPSGILIGTQMLAKGHHFANVTLVLMLDCDYGLSSVDFRALERFGQLLTQVTGRAGREAKKGLALIQTHYPQHPELNLLVSHGYHRFACDILAQRKQLQLPPFSHQALIRLEDKDPFRAEQSLKALASINQLCLSIGPYPANLQRRAHYYRYCLLLQHPNRGALQQTIKAIWQRQKRHVNSQQRFAIDIDPQEII